MCVTGTAAWETIAHEFRVPAAVAGYTHASILAAIHAVLRQCMTGAAHVDNCYQALVRPEGNPLALDRMFRVFDVVDGVWRGLGRVNRTAYRLRFAFDVINADARFPDYREQWHPSGREMPDGCQCAAVLLGRQEPADCRRFAAGCRVDSPYGPCMASEDGTCYLRSGERRVA